MSHAASDPAAREIHITRVFDAPRELVFRAWTEPEHLAQWFAPHGCEVEFREFDLRPGGGFRSCIHTPDGHQCWCRVTCRALAAPSRLELVMAVTDAEGRVVEPTAVGMDPEWPRETALTVTFSEHDGKTTMTLHQAVNEALAKRTGAYPSWLQMFDRLASLLAKAGPS